ncbi:RNA polymerase sigma factor [Actinocorallia lasiicapitis]
MLETHRLSDAEVIASSRARPEEFAALFDRYAPMIHRYVHRRIGPEGAEDLVADTFLAAFAGRGRYDPAYEDARPWLFGIATKLVAKHRRAEGNRLRAVARAPYEDERCPADRVAEEVSAHAARKVLARALSRLNQGERDTLLLIAWAQLSYEETAAALGVPIGTVRSRLSRARQKIRRTVPFDPTEVIDGL